jgi:hypothetical protein
VQHLRDRALLCSYLISLSSLPPFFRLPLPVLPGIVLFSSDLPLCLSKNEPLAYGFFRLSLPSLLPPSLLISCLITSPVRGSLDSENFLEEGQKECH